MSESQTVEFPSDHAARPWWEGAVLYQIYPLSYADSNGDGWGDLPGVTQHLEHVARLGADGIWLSPFFKSPMNDFGYDCEDFCAVDPRLGTMADFDALLARAHGLGLKVLIDQVYTYSSNRHPWFEESRSSRDNPRHDWYVWADAKPDGTPPNNWQSIFGGPAWEWDVTRRQYYLTHFYPEMPHLNVNNPKVRQALLEVADFWLARGVDGFRLDVINLAMVDPELRDNPSAGISFDFPTEAQLHLYDRSWPENLGFMRDIHDLIKVQPDRHTLAELTPDKPRDNNMAYLAPGHLDTAYFVISPAETELSAVAIREQVIEIMDFGAWPTWAFSNHDIVRAVTRCGGQSHGSRFAELLIAILVCLRGNLLVYQGDELGLPHAEVPREKLRDREGMRFFPHSLKRDGARTPMPWSPDEPTGADPWLPYDPRHLALNVKDQARDITSTLEKVRGWLALRKGVQTLRVGDISMLPLEEPLLGWTRTLGNGKLLCIFNVGPSQISYRVVEDGPWRSLHSTPGADFDSAVLSLPPFAAVVLEQGIQSRCE
jgi:alpha-glucosidase